MLSEYKYPCGIRRLSSLIAAFLVLPMAAGTALAQLGLGDDMRAAMIGRIQPVLDDRPAPRGRKPRPRRGRSRQGDFEHAVRVIGAGA